MSESCPEIGSLQISEHPEPTTLCGFAELVLKSHAIADKCKWTNLCCQRWRSGSLTEIGVAVLEDYPARPLDLVIVEPGKTPKRKAGGSLKNSIALLHSLCHIESWAIDLSWDVLARWAGPGQAAAPLPRDFFDDWLRIAEDECRHYCMLKDRLVELGSHHGDLPVHEGLWESAVTTFDSLMARLAIEHIVHEGRGLDVTPGAIEKFKRTDAPTAAILTVIYEEEISHVAAGIRWLSYLCENSNPPLDPKTHFYSLVGKYFRGNLKPPFNDYARGKAGMTPDWYLPLVTQKPIRTKEEREAEKASRVSAAASMPEVDNNDLIEQDCEAEQDNE